MILRPSLIQPNHLIARDARAPGRVYLSPQTSEPQDLVETYHYSPHLPPSFNSGTQISCHNTYTTSIQLLQT
jgi:hypothetical protein